MIRKLTCFALLAILCGCQPKPAADAETKAKAPDSKEISSVRKLGTEGTDAKRLWPLGKDNEWHYAVAVSPTKGPEEIELAIRVTQTNGTKSTLEISEERNGTSSVLESMEYDSRPDGLYQLSSKKGTVPMAPALLIGKLPLKAGEVVEQVITGAAAGSQGKPVQQKVKTEYRGIEVIDTDSGRMEAHAVTSTSEYQIEKNQMRTSTTSYWVPSIGLVRYFQQIQSSNGASQTETWRLKNHKIINP